MFVGPAGVGGKLRENVNLRHLKKKLQKDIFGNSCLQRMLLQRLRFLCPAM